MATQLPDFYAKHGETFSIRATLTGADGVAQNLTLATGVVLTLRPKGGGTPVYNKVPCGFTAAPGGQVSYDSPAVIDPAAIPAGLYDLDFAASFPGGIVHKFPNGGPFTADTFLLVKISEAAA